ncbi:RNA polymerase sigma factor [Amycolatopsis japonica]|uniref:RNA polymerase sigma factor n=1 Tax=Amycolatopsis japonica TaxID=208439 RepID=UPI0036707ABA
MSVHREGAAGHDQRAKLRCNAIAEIATRTNMPAPTPLSPHDDDPGLLAAARDEAERRASESEARRKRDLDLRAELAIEDFSGVGWDRYANELARYGIAVMVVWMRTGKIFVECARLFRAQGRKKFALPPSPENWTDEDRDDIAAVLVTKALTTFKQKALRAGGWTYAGGASLSTYFIGTCTYEFPNAYTQWMSQYAAASERRRREQVVADTVASPADPAAMTVRADQVRRALAQIRDDRTRIVVQLKAEGYSHAEIAESLGENGFPDESDNSVRGIWQRHKRRMHQEGGADDV